MAIILKNLVCSIALTEIQFSSVVTKLTSLGVKLSDPIINQQGDTEYSIVRAGSAVISSFRETINATASLRSPQQTHIARLVQNGIIIHA